MYGFGVNRLGVSRGVSYGDPAVTLFRNAEAGTFLDFTESQVFSDTAGTTPAAVGEGIANANDRSPNDADSVQATSTARPILARVPRGGRRNSLTYTEEFDNAAWGLSGMLSPADQGSGVWKIIENTSDVGRSTFQPSKTGNKFSVEVKSAGDARWLRFQAGVVSSWFNPDTGLAGTVASGHTIDVVALADGWYRVNHTRNTSAAGSFALGLATGNSNTVYLGDGASGLLVRKPQAEEGSFTNYQRVGSIYDVTEAGVESIYHAVFDNVDDVAPITLPAITGGTVALFGITGYYIASLTFAGGTFSLGPTTYTGGAAGVIALLGGRVLSAVITDRALTSAERSALIAWGVARGADNEDLNP